MRAGPDVRPLDEVGSQERVFRRCSRERSWPLPFSFSVLATSARLASVAQHFAMSSPKAVYVR